MPSLPAATDFLVRSALLQILWTSLLGWMMTIAHQPWGGAFVKLRSRDVAMAHVDWIMLSLVQIATAYILTLKVVPEALLLARLIAFSGWYAPTVYMLRAWGINGFRLDGRKAIDTVVGLLGFTGTAAFTYAWCQIVRAWL
jgi:hypothetical protein